MQKVKKHSMKKAISLAMAAMMAISSLSITAFAATVPADVAAPAPGNMLVAFDGKYEATDVTTMLAKVNSIRYEACQEGVIDPNSGVALTPADYAPLKWSQQLEDIAQLRAAEATVYGSHTRTNGTQCFTCTSNGVRSYGENIAWNYNGISKGIDQWYGEKAGYVNQTPNAVTGHYTALISTAYTYIGLGGFTQNSGGWTAVAGEFGEAGSHTETPDTLSGAMAQVIEVQNSKVTAKSLTGSTSVVVGKTAQYGANVSVLYSDGLGALTRTGTPASTISWSSSNPAVLTVDQNGLATAIAVGTATITASFDGLTATADVKVIAVPTITIPTTPTQGAGTASGTGSATGSAATTAAKKVTVKSTKLTKVKAGKKQLKATWKKVSGVTGYQVKYSTSKKFTKKTTKTVTVKKSKTTSKTIKKLKGGKKYYVKVRAYKTVNGKKYYSKWSNVKSVKAKK